MPRKRGRPRAYDPDQALSRAADTFWKAGYAATSLDDLAAATGMNRPSLYAAFGDKRELYLKTLAFYHDRFRDIARRVTADDPPLKTFLERFYGEALDIYLDGSEPRGCYTVGTATTAAVVDASVREVLAESMNRTDRFLGSRINRAIERGEIAKDANAVALAHIATATMHTLALRARAGIPRRDLEAVVKSAIGLITSQR